MSDLAFGHAIGVRSGERKREREGHIHTYTQKEPERHIKEKDKANVDCVCTYTQTQIHKGTSITARTALSHGEQCGRHNRHIVVEEGQRQWSVKRLDA